MSTATTQHTPGPWIADHQCRSSASEPRNVQVKAFHDGDAAPMKRIATCYFGESDAERMANARLIAAGPELLAALFGLVFGRLGARTSPQGNDQWQIWADRYRDDPKVDAGLLSAVDAIAKATGGAQ